MTRDWLSRLEGAEPFSPLPEPPPVQPARSLGGLAAGAVPDRVRASHGYVPQFPSDAPVPPREKRPGDFFRS